MTKKNWLWIAGLALVAFWLYKRKAVASAKPANPVPGPYGIVYMPGTNEPVAGPGY